MKNARDPFVTRAPCELTTRLNQRRRLQPWRQQAHSGTVAQWHSCTVAQWHSGTVAQCTVAQLHSGTGAQCTEAQWHSVAPTGAPDDTGCISHFTGDAVAAQRAVDCFHCFHCFHCSFNTSQNGKVSDAESALRALTQMG